MPMDRSRYPDDWDEIARRVKDEEGWRCEGGGIEIAAHAICATTRVITRRRGKPGKPGDRPEQDRERNQS